MYAIIQTGAFVVARPMQLAENWNFGIIAPSFCLLPGAQDKRRSMVERGHFDHMGITDGMRENILTYDEVFARIDSLATIPFEGERGVKALQEQFQGTFFERALRRLYPHRDAVAAEELEGVLNLSLDENDDEEKGDRLSVVHRRVYRVTDDELRSDRKYHFDWQGRATAYRLAAVQATGGLPVDDLDTLAVDFTTVLSDPHEFVLYEERTDWMRDLALLQDGALQTVEEDHGWAVVRRALNDRKLEIEQKQYRIIEQDNQGRWVERGAMTFVTIDERVTAPLGSEENEIIVRSSTALLPATLPPDLFDEKKQAPGSWAPEISHSIFAAMPSDLQIPEDLLFADGFYPDVDDSPQEYEEPL